MTKEARNERMVREHFERAKQRADARDAALRAAGAPDCRQHGCTRPAASAGLCLVHEVVRLL